MDGFLSKEQELLVYFNDTNPHIICLVEVLPKSGKQSDFSQINIPGYQKFHPDETRSKRGAVIFTRNDLDVMPIPELNSCNFEETIWIKVRFENESVVCGLIYRNPSSSAENNQHLNDLINMASELSKSCHLFIVGDFNFKSIDWETYNTLPDATPSIKEFLVTTLQNNLFQHVNSWTRVRGNDQPSILDLIFTNNEHIIESVHTDCPIGKSDHCVLSANLNLHVKDSPINEVHDFRRADLESISNYLQSIPWDEKFTGIGVNECWSIFKDVIHNQIQQHVPLKRQKSSSFRNRHLWMNRDTKNAINKKKTLWKKNCSCPTPYALKRYNVARNKCNQIIRNAKYTFEQKITSEIKDSPKPFWDYIHSQSKNHSPIPNLIKPDGTQTNTDEEKCKTLNSFFASVFTKDDTSSTPPPLPTRNHDTKLEEIVCSESEVLDKLVKLKVNKAPGPDNIHPLLLKHIAPIISYPLSCIYNKSLSEGKLPDDWKFAVITALHKKGDKTNPNNYRPVSLTSILCKVLESIIRDKIENHLKINNLLSSNQYGFRSGRSCNTQLLDALDTWTKCLNEGDDVDIILLDFSKAFDSVSHPRLISKLESYGITGKLQNWIKNFLSERKQAVKIKQTLSTTEDVLSGVPQGSVLGPTLFLLFINDLPDVVNCHVKIFADDTKLFQPIKSPSDIEKLQNDLNSLHLWSKTWGLNFNTAKCVHLHVGKKQEPHTY